MKSETLEALRRYITVVEVTIRTVADIGPGASLDPLKDASDRLSDALDSEPVDKADQPVDEEDASAR